MFSYTAREICSQLCCLILAFAFAALPLAQAAPRRAPILVPLATRLVPLGAALESPADRTFQLPSFQAPGRMILGPTPAQPASPPRGSRLRISRHISYDPIAIDRPSGRSPPSA